VASLRLGDEQAFAALVTAWASSMMRLARSHVPSDSVAEEVVQDTWLAVLNGLDGFRGRSSLRTWVFRILVNQAKTRGVRERRTVPFASLAPDEAAPSVDPSRFRGPEDRYPGGWRVFPPEWPEEVALSNEVHEVVRTALDTLPPRQRAVVSLRDLAGHTSEEVSAMLQITTGNQRVLLHRGRSVVRAHLESYFANAPVGEVG
jgi:RNA polymerase sigma-70 factor (ECF subfamily)